MHWEPACSCSETSHALLSWFQGAGLRPMHASRRFHCASGIAYTFRYLIFSDRSTQHTYRFAYHDIFKDLVDPLVKKVGLTLCVRVQLAAVVLNTSLRVGSGTAHTCDDQGCLGPLLGSGAVGCQSPLTMVITVVADHWRGWAGEGGEDAVCPHAPWVHHPPAS
jgi:hypothetical protein